MSQDLKSLQKEFQKFVMDRAELPAKISMQKQTIDLIAEKIPSRTIHFATPALSSCLGIMLVEDSAVPDGEAWVYSSDGKLISKIVGLGK